MLKLERDELSKLVSHGYSFAIEVKDRSWFNLKRNKKTSVREFTIHEPTLSILDRIARESIEIAIDEDAMKRSGIDAVNSAKEIALKHSKRCARVLAIAVLGEDIYKQRRRGDSFLYREDKVRIEKLSTLFEHSITPSRLLELFGAVISMMNLGDFIYSIRLIQTHRPAMPNRIETELEG